MFGKRPPKIRTLLLVGRVANLPTVWADCLAAWYLAGGQNVLGLLGAGLALSLFYLGAMFLNDAFDADYDRSRRITRPIPAGLISESEVWTWGFAFLATAVCLTAVSGLAALVLAVMLAAGIIIYDAIHRAVPLSPLLMGWCRLLAFLIAASGGERGITGSAIWAGLALAAYVAGVDFVARGRYGAPAALWPLIFLGAPLGLAWLSNDGFHDFAGFIVLALVGWMAWALRHAERNAGYAASQLLAAIVIVDMLAAGHMSTLSGLLFVPLFIGALFLRRLAAA